MIQIMCPCGKHISQNFYNRILSSISLNQLPCPTCKHKGCFIWYGTYTRSVNEGGSKTLLVVSRILCKECSANGHLHTHAILLVSMIPYCQTPLHLQVDIINAYECCTGSLFEILEDNPLIDMNYVYRLCAVYRSFWKERLRSEGIPLRPIDDLPPGCFRYYSRQFMQIKSTPNILFQPPT